MPKKNDSWGIEIGANAIKAMRLVRNGSQIELAEYDILPFKQILTTPDLNVEEAIQVNLDTFLSKHDVSKSRVMVSVPGYAAFARFVNLPPVEPRKIPDIVRFEAVQQIPFPMEQVEWDYQTFQSEESPDVEVGIFAITKERIASHLSNYRRVDMRVDGVTLSPLAVYNAFAYENRENTEPEGTIYLDIGTSCTDVIIADGDSIWMRTLPIGGNNFTEALVRSFKLSYPKAERLKREAATSKYARQIFQALRPVFAELVQEIQRSVGYYQSLHRDSRLTQLVGVGSTFRLPGLQKFLKQQLQINVTRPEGFEQIEIEDRRQAALAEQAMNMYTAYGLALQGLDLETISANLLPRQIQMQRMWKAKEPWVAAAAACVVVASGIAGGALFTERAVWRSSLNEHQPYIEQVLNQARQYQQEWRQAREEVDPQGRIDALRGMVDYRTLWPRLVEDVTDVVTAVDPQGTLSEADYETMTRVERDQWQRLFVDQVEVEYLTSDEDDESGMDAGGMGPGDMGPGGMGPGGMGQAADGYQHGQNIDAQSFWPESSEGMSPAEYVEAIRDRHDQGWRPPRFEIVVSGTTPYEDAAGLLSRYAVRWLQEHTVREDRPYRLVVVQEDVLSTPGRVGEADDRTRGRTRDTGRRPARSRTPQAEPPGVDRFDQRARAQRGQAQRGQAAGIPSELRGEDEEQEVRELAFEELFPERPEALQAQPDDWRFEVTWTVELYPPELARRIEAGRPVPEAPPEPATDEVAGPVTPEDESTEPTDTSEPAEGAEAADAGESPQRAVEGERRRSRGDEESAS